MPSQPEPTDLGARRLRAVLAGLVLLESAVLVLAACWLGYLTARHPPTDWVQTAVLALLGLLAGLALLGAARAVRAGQRGVRGLVITWQLVQGAVGANMAGSQLPYVGVPLLLVAAVALGIGVRRQTWPAPPSRPGN